MISDHEWPSVNRRREVLIDKQVDGELSKAEEVELAELQRQAEKYLDQVSPIPPLPSRLEGTAK